MKKILVCITARPSYSRIKTAIEVLQNDPNVDVSVLASGSALLERYGRVVDLIRSDGMKVEEELYTFVEGNEPVNMALTTSCTIDSTSRALARINPDLVVTIADRYETIGTAIAASYCGIPLAHIQGGEVTGNIDERVRHAITKLADVHLVANQDAAHRIRRMGEPESSIFITGCPSLDLVTESNKISAKLVQEAVDARGVGANINVLKDFVVVMQHPETDNFDQSFDQMNMTLEAVDKLDLPTLIFWPNVDAGSDATSKAIRIKREQGCLEKARLLKNLDGKFFLRLLSMSRCLLGNSSVGIRECSFMGVPAVNIGGRQNGRLSGPNVVHSEWDKDLILSNTQLQIASGSTESSSIYGDGKSGEKIAEILSGKVNYQSKRFVD